MLHDRQQQLRVLAGTTTWYFSLETEEETCPSQTCLKRSFGQFLAFAILRRAAFFWSSFAATMSSSGEDWIGGGGADLVEEGPSGGEEEDWGGLDSDVEMADGPAEHPLPLVVAGPEGGLVPIDKKAQRAANARAGKAAKRQRLLEERAAAKPQPVEPEPLPDASELATVLCKTNASNFSTHLKSTTSLAEQLGITLPRIKSHVWAYSHAMLTAWTSRCNALVRHCLGEGREEEDAEGQRPLPSPVLFVRQRKFDETSSVLSCLWDQGDMSWADLEEVYDEEVGPAKVLVTETQAAMVFEQPAAQEGAPAAMAIAWSTPACLRAVEKNSGDCYTAALRDVCSQPYDELVSARFKREVDIVCHDAHSANFRAERMLSTLNPKAAKLTMVCDAHKAAAIPTKIFDLWKEMPTRVIRLALATKGSIAALRRAMREVVAQQLVVLGGVSSAAASHHRSEMLKIFLPSRTPKEAGRKVIIGALFNGDWQRVGQVIHHDNGTIPGGDGGIRRAMMKWGIPALLPRSLKIFARNNWTGAGCSISDIGLLVAVNGLLQAAFSKAFPSKPARAPSVLPLDDLPAGDGPGDGAGGGPGDGSGSDAGDEWVGAAAAGAKEQRDAANWKKQRDEHISGTRQWLRSPSILDDLITAQTLHRPCEKMITVQLATTGSAWEATEQARLQKDGHRKFRPLESHDGGPVRDLIGHFDKQLFEEGFWICLKDKSQRAQAHLFKLAVRGASAAYQLLHARHRNWPYRLWGMLRPGGDTADRLAAAPDCTLDDYSKSYKDYHGAGLGGEAGMRELQVVGQMADTDTASTERLHSVNQRRAKFQVWTHRPDLASMSSWFLSNGHCRQTTDFSLHRGRSGSDTRAIDGGSGSGAVLPVDQKKKSRGGGGAWRAYVHVHAKDRIMDGPAWSELARGYRSLSPAGRKRYDEMGDSAADVHRAGARSLGARERGTSRSVPSIAPGDSDSPPIGDAGFMYFFSWLTSTTHFSFPFIFCRKGCRQIYEIMGCC